MNTTTFVSYVGMFIVGVTAGQFMGEISPHGPTSASTDVSPVSRPLLSRAVPADTRTVVQICRSADEVLTPEEAFSSALAQTDGEWKSAQLTTAFTRLLAHSSGKALREVNRIPIDYRQQVVGSALAQLAAQQPERVLGYLEGISDNYATYLGIVLAVIAQRDPRRAVDIAMQNTHRDPTGEAFRTLIPVLVQSNLEMGASAVGAMSKPSVALIQQVASEYARNDPDRAYQWTFEVARHNGRDSVNEAVDALSVSLAISSPELAANFLSRTPDPIVRNSLIRAISQQMGQQDLHSAWAWLSQYRTDSSYSENARNLLYRWCYVKPEEVAELLVSIEDREIRSAVADELAAAWQRKDPEAYEAWLGSRAIL